jgi:CRP-like cAMP-binding protein
MAQPISFVIARQNRLLAKLPHDDIQAMLPYSQHVRLGLSEGIFESGQPLEYAYFPTKGLLSIVRQMHDGDMIEVAALGTDGGVGTQVLLGQRMLPYRCFVQIEGSAIRVGIDTLRELATQRSTFQQYLLRYHSSLTIQIMQNAACNGLHSIATRCCRWLLIARDRIDSEEIHLTHEYLGHMLGVRRAGVTEVLRELRELGLINYTRGHITLLDPAALEEKACECYRVIAEEFAWLDVG